MFFKILLLLYTCTPATHASRHIYDSPSSHPFGWSKTTKRANPDATLHLHFLLRPTNVKELLNILETRSDPSSPKYGQHMSADEVSALTRPTLEALDAVHQFLVTATAVTSDIFVVETSVANAEALLGCEYFEHLHAPTGRIALRTSSYSLPLEISEHVAAVTPTVSLYTIPTTNTKTMMKSTSTSISTRNHLAPSQLVNIPSSLRSLYGVNSTQATSGRTKQAVTGFIQQLYSKSDFAEFQKLYVNASQLNYTLNVTQLKCVGDDGSPSFLGGTEAMLDAEYITALGANITTEFWGFKGNGNDPGLWLKWMVQVANTTNEDVPKVFSCSYGEDEYTMANDFADRVNIEFVKAGVRGISILVASGDSGAADQKNHCKNKKFTPKWPAASPYITSVGGTGGLIGTYETAADLSSGGFSNRYPTPKWQKEAVEKYLSSSKISNKTREYINNTKGRGFPDVSAQAIDFMVVADFIPLPVMGTSCAAPTFSGIVSLLNDVREMNGKSSLGFLNPLLFSKDGAASLNDITFGSGGGCFDSSDNDNGFPALPGWDAGKGGSVYYDSI